MLNTHPVVLLALLIVIAVYFSVMDLVISRDLGFIQCENGVLV